MLTFPLPFHTLSFHIKEFLGSRQFAPFQNQNFPTLPLVITTLDVSTQLFNSVSKSTFHKQNDTAAGFNNASHEIIT